MRKMGVSMYREMLSVPCSQEPVVQSRTTKDLSGASQGLQRVIMGGGVLRFSRSAGSRRQFEGSSITDLETSQASSTVETTALAPCP